MDDREIVRTRSLNPMALGGSARRAEPEGIPQYCRNVGKLRNHEPGRPNGPACEPRPAGPSEPTGRWTDAEPGWSPSGRADGPMSDLLEYRHLIEVGQAIARIAQISA